MAFKISAKFSKSRRFIENSPLKINLPGIELTVASENIEKPTIWEIHEKRHTLVVHLSGKINSIETEINHRASKLNPPTDGDFWLIPADSKYATYTQGKEVDYAEFCFDLNYLKNLLGEKAKDYTLVPQIGSFDNFLYQNVKQLVSLISKTDDISKLIEENISQNICLYLFGNYNVGNFTSIKNYPKFTTRKFSLLQEYIYDNLSQKITLEDLSRAAEIGQDKLLRSFSSSFGKTPAQYIIEQRLRKARSLLANTGKNITTIAQETGFSSHSHLSSTFKKNLGITPQNFRQRC